jgi:hypothetical protein
MTATSQNFSMYQGDDFTLTVTVKDAAGAAKNLTGATIKWALHTTNKAAVPKLSKAIGTGIAVTDAAGGVFTVTIARADTAALKAGAYYHEVEITDVASKRATVLTGKATILQALIV